MLRTNKQSYKTSQQTQPTINNISSSVAEQDNTVNPLKFRGKYSAASNNNTIKLTLAVDPLMGGNRGLLHLVQRGGDWAPPTVGRKQHEQRKMLHSNIP